MKLMLSLFVFLFTHFTFASTTIWDYEAQTGEGLPSQINLQDGSKVWVIEKLDISFTEDEKQSVLESLNDKDFFPRMGQVTDIQLEQVYASRNMEELFTDDHRPVILYKLIWEGETQGLGTKSFGILSVKSEYEKFEGDNFSDVKDLIGFEVETSQNISLNYLELPSLIGFDPTSPDYKIKVMAWLVITNDIVLEKIIEQFKQKNYERH